MAAHKPRNPNFMLTDEHRVKIKNSNILSVLIAHVEGSREMAATQVTAALGLLKKVMPDLSSVEHKTENPLASMSDDELTQLIERAKHFLAEDAASNLGSGAETTTRH